LEGSTHRVQHFSMLGAEVQHSDRNLAMPLHVARYFANATMASRAQ
jgi:hypothetical protein